MSLSERVPANQLLDMLAAVHDRDGPPGFMQFDALCNALGSSEVQLGKLLGDLEALDAVQVDWAGRVVFLTRDGYAIARPGDQTYALS